MENAKMLILNNKQDKSFKAVVNLKLDSPSLIKFYNLSSSKRNFALGIKQSGNVVKVPLEVNENNCKFALPKNINLQDKLFCAVVDVTNAFCPEIVLSGSLNSDIENTKIESAFVQTKPEDCSVLYEEDNSEQIEELIDKNLQEDATSIYYDSCSNCKYRQAFYEGDNCTCVNFNATNNSQNKPFNIQNSNINLIPTQKTNQNVAHNYNVFNVNVKNSSFEKDDISVNKLENIDNNFENNLINNYNNTNDINYQQNVAQNFSNYQFNNDDESEKSNEDIIEAETFYEQIKSQLDGLFNKYPQEETLQRIISNSKWSRIDYDKEQNYYVLGLIYDDNFKDVEYIAYGMPSNDNINPPDDLKEFAQWLSINEGNDVFGYWIVYQDAKTGETVNVQFE